ncbi:unsaturated chondroitin disaccharide hydrolase [Deinococcus reticulitermitis]|uniref:Unsaturated chondroitin disaccharide hydrolase n=1 Tax=Deinococcus reticulitermitis TaxID=856736 RepID=A0A1H7CEC3_9DEIO|nr:glycoside hydrolase family 88 protein [Deinococcus reticulitermitis]SEJ86927.1 unsaturated chondroitin disaccharide hydrolase [Deinococcus reticulitermitis]
MTATPPAVQNTQLFTQRIQDALTITRQKMRDFDTVFPDDTSSGQVYSPRAERMVQTRTGPRMSLLGENVGWTTGFWTGQLWLAYELTGDQAFADVAAGQLPSFERRLTERIDVDHHDVGFLYTLSAVAQTRLTGSGEAREVGLRAAEQLLTRYLPSAGILQAWGELDDPEQRGRIIIDCLMNLPLLYWASAQSGETRYAEAARRHAHNSLRTVIRHDSTTFHTFFFNAETGEPSHGRTSQGSGDDSCWSRGQAWGIYGFALSYMLTRDEAFLTAARQLADYFLVNLPEDGVVYWDFAFRDGDGEEKDSSAAAIAVCGLHELAKWLPEAEARPYRDAAADILTSLCQAYAATPGGSSNALLLHGVYGKPGGDGVDEANLWGDYFYLEALVRHTRDWSLFW